MMDSLMSFFPFGPTSSLLTAEQAGRPPTPIFSRDVFSFFPTVTTNNDNNDDDNDLDWQMLVVQLPSPAWIASSSIVFALTTSMLCHKTNGSVCDVVTSLTFCLLQGRILYLWMEDSCWNDTATLWDAILQRRATTSRLPKVVLPPSQLYEPTTLGRTDKTDHSSGGTGTVTEDESTATHCSCCICLTEFEPQKSYVCVTSCQHIFHSTCLQTWFQRSNQCPYCRTPQQSSSPPQ